jgi:hypothetical protein
MPKFKARSASEIKQILNTKFGFEPVQGKDEGHSHYVLQMPDHDGSLITIAIFFSGGGHAGKSVGPGLEKMMARELQVNTGYLRGMLDCSRSKPDYFNQVRDNPTLTDMARLRRRKR